MNLLLAGAILGLFSSADRPAAPTLPFLIGANWSADTPEAVKKLFLETGCNFVRLAGGGYGWATQQHVDALKFFKPYGVQALVQLGSHWPDGKYLDRTQDYFVDDQGQSGKHVDSGVEYGDQFWPQLTYASDSFRKSLESDYTAYLQALKPYDNVRELLLHNEPGYFWLNDRVFDYNPQAIAKFREWLPSQYSSIGELNQRWGTNFGAFAQVDPPRQRPPVSQIAAWMDWRRFNAWLIQDFLKWESDFVKTQRPNLPNMTNLAGPLDNWFPLRLADNYKFASASDAACVDIYANEWTNRFFPGLAMDMERGVAKGRPVVVAECDSYDPKNFPALTDQQRGDRLESDLWTYIGHGARGILVWSLSSEEGYTLTNGEFNPRVAALRQTAHEAKMIGLDDFSRPPAPVALCVDQDAFLYLGGLYPARDGASLMQSAMTGLYAALVQAGNDVDIICTDDVRAGRLGQYKALVMATPAIADKLLAKQLTSYVNAGGVLIAESPFAQWDRWGRPADRKALGLDDLFGLSIQPPDVNSVGGPKFDWSAHSRVDLIGAQSFEPVGMGRLRCTIHSVGQGEAILFDSNIGISNSNGGDAEATAILGKLLGTYAHLAPSPFSIQGDHGYVDARTLQDGKGNSLIVLTNPADKKEPIQSKKVDMKLNPGLFAHGSELFVFESFKEENGDVRAGAFREKGNDPGAIQLDSAKAFLIAKNHAPLLAMDTPTKAKLGAPISVSVTVFNPSPSAVTGIASVSGQGWNCKSATVTVRPRTSYILYILARPVSNLGRSPIKPVFAQTGKKVEGVPVDVDVSQ